MPARAALARVPKPSPCADSRSSARCVARRPTPRTTDRHIARQVESWAARDEQNDSEDDEALLPDEWLRRSKLCGGSCPRSWPERRRGGTLGVVC